MRRVGLYCCLVHIFTPKILLILCGICLDCLACDPSPLKLLIISVEEEVEEKYYYFVFVARKFLRLKIVSVCPGLTLRSQTTLA